MKKKRFCVLGFYWLGFCICYLQFNPYSSMENFEIQKMLSAHKNSACGGKLSVDIYKYKEKNLEIDGNIVLKL